MALITSWYLGSRLEPQSTNILAVTVDSIVECSPAWSICESRELQAEIRDPVPMIGTLASAVLQR